MRPKSIIVIFVMLAVSCLMGMSDTDYRWQPARDGFNYLQVYSLIEEEPYSRHYYAGTNRGLYRLTPEGRLILVVGTRTIYATVNDLFIGKGAPQDLYVATDEGAFVYNAANGATTKIFHALEPAKSRCLSIISTSDRVYLGTAQGLYERKLTGGLWQSVPGRLRNQPVYHLEQDASSVYAAGPARLIRIDKQSGQQAVIFNRSGFEQSREDDFEKTDEDDPSNTAIRDIVLDRTLERLYVVTESRIFYTEDQGRHWQSLTNSGRRGSLQSMALLEDGTPAVATSQGVFIFDSRHWRPLYAGLTASKIFTLAGKRLRDLVAGTDAGVFRIQERESEFNPFAKEPLSQNSISFEPTVQQVQAMAIDYAEVHPDKIARWRALARRRAILPDLSVGLDRNTSDLFHWNTGASPDELQKGRDFLDWDVSLSWDLGDLIWSSDQTSIDSRSKLMVELREDILDQVTRLYFERRRLQLNVGVPQEMEIDPREQQLRIEELTALIDAYTGGGFSREIERRKVEDEE